MNSVQNEILRLLLLQFRDGLFELLDSIPLFARLLLLLEQPFLKSIRLLLEVANLLLELPFPLATDDGATGVTCAGANGAKGDSHSA